jgi:PilZ domain-containing protein
MPPQTNRRAWDRHPADPRTVCDLLIDEAIECRALAVGNISRGGARLLVGRRVAPGEPLLVFLHNEGRRVSCVRPARVVYTFPAPGGAYVLGLAFHQELSTPEVEELRAVEAQGRPALPPVSERPGWPGRPS